MDRSLPTIVDHLRPVCKPSTACIAQAKTPKTTRNKEQKPVDRSLPTIVDRHRPVCKPSTKLVMCIWNCDNYRPLSDVRNVSWLSRYNIYWYLWSSQIIQTLNIMYIINLLCIILENWCNPFLALTHVPAHVYGYVFASPTSSGVW